MPDVDRKLVDPIELAATTKATALRFVNTDCLIANGYAPDVRKMHDRYATDGVAFWLAYPNPADVLSVEALEKGSQLTQDPFSDTPPQPQCPVN